MGGYHLRGGWCWQDSCGDCQVHGGDIILGVGGAGRILVVTAIRMELHHLWGGKCWQDSCGDCHLNGGTPAWWWEVLAGFLW